jgi:PA14 domain/Periplasmic copper-binding protein (NosD)/Right handed beta helix region
MTKAITLLLLAATLLASCGGGREIALTQGLTITHSVTIKQDTFWLNDTDSPGRPVLTIEGEGITVDFNGAVLAGSNNSFHPDAFSGTAILIKGKNITLKNAVVRGYKVAVMAEGVDSLKLLDCNFSYNWRPRLKSIREREDFSDWLSFHHNEADEWLQYGAAMYLKNCPHALVRGVTVTAGMNGLMLTGCNDGLFYNNNIQFNSGVGAGLYRSSRNRIMHNRLDWNVRGYSHSFYQRGQDSAALLVYEQSSENTFAYNSATHSGDGFFLWAGQSTMDTGEGGCNDNLIYKNDFSHAPTNGIEVTFSRNKIIGNEMKECTYGVWGGYSFGSLFYGNRIEGCRYGIAIEHGQENTIWGNEFRNDTTGVQLWERPSQPADWGYAQNRDVASRDYNIGNNTFSRVKIPLKISASKNLTISSGNRFEGFEKLLVEEKPNADLRMDAAIDYPPPPDTVAKLPDGMDASLPEDHLRGRQYILVDEWGPYDFRSPAIWLRTIEGGRYTFLLLGPQAGNYKIAGGEGWSHIRGESGTFPDTLICTRKPEAERLTLDLEFTGEAFTGRFGNFNKKERVFPFRFSRFEKKFDWQVRWYNYDESSDPVQHYEAFQALKNKPAPAADANEELYYAWWGSPAEGIEADKFATFAETEFDIAEGNYTLALTSDDGAKLYLDGKLLIDHWDIHEPATDEVPVKLGGRHRLEIEHFEAGGFATLDFRMAVSE